tara:strand:+ start:76507 stop:77514 length:1008 start_codon:yes stop_codon:yes gene_type:complete
MPRLSLILKLRILFTICTILVLFVRCKNTPKQNSESSFLTNLDSPILIEGDDHKAFRDPLIIFEDEKFWLFYSVATNETDSIIQGKAFWQTAYSTSQDLKNWSAPKFITPKDLSLNYASPGSINKVGDEWVLALQTYPTPNGEKFGNKDSRLWTMRSTDLKNWSSPELMMFMGENVPQEDMPRMIDPCIIQDKNEDGKWWCFSKINSSVNMSWSKDLDIWNYEGFVEGGENACVIVQDDKYILFHSPENGIGIKQSSDLRDWQDITHLTLGQNNWPWSQGRITAGYVLDARNIPNVGTYIMVFHGEKDKDSFTVNCNIGIAWSDDLKTWHWPVEK